MSSSRGGSQQSSTTNNNFQADARGVLGISALGSELNNVTIQQVDSGIVEAAQQIANNALSFAGEVNEQGGVNFDRSFDSFDNAVDVAFDFLEGAGERQNESFDRVLDASGDLVKETQKANQATVSKVSAALQGFGKDLSIANRTTTQDALAVIKPLAITGIVVFAGVKILETLSKK
jgi:hypothetical protein